MSEIDVGALAPHMKLFHRLREQAAGRMPADKPAATEIPVEPYLSEELLAREKAALLARHPIIIGHGSQIPEPGHYFTHDHLGKPLLIVRGKDGVVRAFLNVCRHRGMRLAEAETPDKTPVFVCPYHHWTYKLDGSLRNAPLKDSFDGVDLSCRGLKAVSCVERHGFIWAQLEGEMDIDAFLGTIGNDLDAFGVPTSVAAKGSTTTRAANWKLIVEAFQDGYHVVRLHKDTVGPFFPDGVAVSERVNYHMRAAVARKEMTDVLDAPSEAWNPRFHASPAHYVFPNSILVFHPDYISHLGLYPKGPGETVITHTFLAPKLPEGEEAENHLNRSFDLIENGVFQSEDYMVCEGAQKGMASGANETFLLSGHEEGIMMFHEILADALKDSAQS